MKRLFLYIAAVILLLLIGTLAGAAAGYVLHRNNTTFSSAVAQLWRATQPDAPPPPPGMWFRMPEDWEERQQSSPDPVLWSRGHEPSVMALGAQGTLLHMWNRPPWDGDGGPNVQRTYWRRVRLRPDGSLLALHHDGPLLCLDSESNIQWTAPGPYLSDVVLDASGRIITLAGKDRVFPYVHDKNTVLDESLVILDALGNEVRRFSLLDALKNSPYESLLRRAGYWGELLHVNALQVLGEGPSAHHPAFQAGRVLVSMWKIDAVAVVDLEEEKVVWAMAGMWRRQRDADILDNGHLLITENSNEGNRLSVLEIDPVTQELAWRFDDIGAAPRDAGPATAERLPNGNTLICESAGGRAFAVNPSGAIVWQHTLSERSEDGRWLAGLVHAEPLSEAQLQRLPERADE